ncbi:MAG TPA: alpha/beta fold hydrolase [Ideonella sp.]|nr:alpha/beta fold hydrolase [Ideonella sp.]
MPLDLAYEAVGNGPPLLILHGLFGASGNWHSIARALSLSHRVISVDLRNHGGSPWAAAMGYLEMADDVRDLIEREGWEPPVVMGHSMGGKTAMALALCYPQLVSRLIVVDIAPVSYGDRLSGVAEAMRGIDLLAAASRDEVQRQLAGRLHEPGVVPFLMQNLVARDGRFDWRFNLAAISAALPALTGFPAALRSLRYDGPLQVIAGGLSDHVRGSDGDEFRPLFPQVRVEVIEEAGHWVHAEQRAAFLACVTQALQAQARPAAHATASP